MKSYFYHLLIFLTLLICQSGAVFAQAYYEGQVVDKNTEAAIPSVTVILSKTQTATRTNEQGYFSLNAPAAVEKESLVFTCVGYQTYTLPVSAYKRGMFIAMQPSSAKLKEVEIRYRKKTQKLGEFTRGDLDAQISWSVSYPFYSATMYAKLFETSKQDAVITSIDLGRWQPGPDAWDMQPGKTSMFKVHIMTVNPANGAPDSILATKEISLADRSRKVTVRFDSTNVVLPPKKFFVAIEWLPLPYNEYILKGGNARLETRANGEIRTWQNGGFDRVIYQPILVRYERSTNPISWKLVNGAWTRYKHPGSEIALSATINY
ncbi:carboxypeptidase-like regulatory domain-containing protein [Mucilaginibacter sp. dw_454]|uniref:carboxypeptidase-like regulatory domain-containing protein n=1 Tax=Mucilaginibacter sp. dw_454 TaxID=2720079 RepID=UPI001BD3212F|nr:carboxypeptidase-like regulatory domain-containing protein [Mucilaginibacter sp. dw_454]